MLCFNASCVTVRFTLLAAKKICGGGLCPSEPTVHFVYHPVRHSPPRRPHVPEEYAFLVPLPIIHFSFPPASPPPLPPTNENPTSQNTPHHDERNSKEREKRERPNPPTHQPTPLLNQNSIRGPYSLLLLPCRSSENKEEYPQPPVPMSNARNAYSPAGNSNPPPPPPPPNPNPPSSNDCSSFVAFPCASVATNPSNRTTLPLSPALNNCNFTNPFGENPLKCKP